MALRECAGAFALIVCAAMLASCAQLSAVRNALFDTDSDAGARLPDPPEDAPKSDGQEDYVAFVQDVMAESAKLSERAPHAGKATRAATGWRGPAAGGQGAESD